MMEIDIFPEKLRFKKDLRLYIMSKMLVILIRLLYKIVRNIRIVLPNISKTNYVRFQILSAASMKFRIVFWDVLPCKIIVDRRFIGRCCLHHQGSLIPDDVGSTYP
jgi:hypothetical protein